MQFLIYRASDDAKSAFVKKISNIKELITLKEKYQHDLIITDNPFYKEKNAPDDWDKIPYAITIYDDYVE